MVLLGLAAETCNYIGGDSAVGYYAAYGLYAVEVPLACVLAIHGLEHCAASALHGQVDALAHVGLFGNDMQCLVTHVLGVRRGKADACLRCVLCNAAQ